MAPQPAHTPHGLADPPTAPTRSHGLAHPATLTPYPLPAGRPHPPHPPPDDCLAHPAPTATHMVLHIPGTPSYGLACAHPGLHQRPRVSAQPHV
eukprot:3257417-Pyramimonas_sp.AAC.1